MTTTTTTTLLLRPRVAFAALIVAASLVAAFLLFPQANQLRPSLLPRCLPSSPSTSVAGAAYSATGAAALAEAAVFYATTSVIPQQSRAEISLAHAVLRRRAPCNFLVFGLGRDSVLWAALNPGGATLFLEEDPEWFRSVTTSNPSLVARLIGYRTRLDQANALLARYRGEPACLPPRATVAKGDDRCPLALSTLPDEVYEREWDVLMIDAPKGYFASAPGRMAPVYSAAVMAAARRGEGDTDVFLHDVNRRVEKVFAKEFLCERFRVGAVGRLWHFRIPSAATRANSTAATDAGAGGSPFCSD